VTDDSLELHSSFHEFANKAIKITLKIIEHWFVQIAQEIPQPVIYFCIFNLFYTKPTIFDCMQFTFIFKFYN
jgi:hypothetical protein